MIKDHNSVGRIVGELLAIGRLLQRTALRRETEARTRLRTALLRCPQTARLMAARLLRKKLKASLGGDGN